MRDSEFGDLSLQVSKEKMETIILDMPELVDVEDGTYRTKR